MRVSLIKNDQISDLILPNVVKGSYWITDIDEYGNDRNLISIEADNKKWKLVSNNDISYVNNNLNAPFAILELYNFYYLKNTVNDTNMLIYCTPVDDPTFVDYSIEEHKNRSLMIGSSNECDIVYQFNNIPSTICSITFVNNAYLLKSAGLVFVNNILVNNQQILENGDCIFIMGLKIILTIRSGRAYLSINNPNNLVTTRLVALPDTTADKPYNESEEEIEIQLYTDDDNFHKKPRFFRTIEEFQLNIDAPPGKQTTEDKPWILTVGPMITMSMMSLTSSVTTINNIIANGVSYKSALPSIIVCVAMLCSTFLWPTISRRYDKKKREKNEKMRQEKYQKYIDDQRKVIQEEIAKQKNILIDAYPTTLECQGIILSRLTRLWERRIRDGDFLTINLGVGNEDMKISINYPQEHFSLAEDNLVEIARELGKEPKQLQNVSIPISLVENNILGIVGNKYQLSNYMSQLFLQILTFHSYDDLKIVMLTNKDKEHNFDFLKITPHIFSNDKSIRYFGTTSEEYNEIFYILEKEFSQRISIDNQKTLFKPHYLIVTDNFKMVRNFDIMKKMLNCKDNKGFSFIILTERITNIPDQCKSFVNIYQEKAELYRNNVGSKAQVFNPDVNNTYKYYECAKVLSNIHIDINSDEEGQLPNKIKFLEMYDVGKIEQLNALNRWKKNNPIMSLSAPVGLGKSGERLSLDLHEKYHGPHGLIAGMTGSGKSEFIITYIVSMAINYHPYEVQFILIDYKGGGLAGAFKNDTLGLKLPHLVGTITNLDANEIKRSLASVESELKRRQKLFNIAREKSSESTVDIYKYQKMYREGLVDEPISHLFIISDEFAELKTQQPEFMSQLISTARIGRSLGVHLILATQKPSGVVDPQIWSNTRFRVCLRVQEKSDSTEVIKKPDAALLKQTGRFYFQVGFDEIFVMGQAAWCGGAYIPSEKIRKELDTSINFIDNVGNITKTVETRKKVQVAASQGEELINIVRYLDNIAKEENIKCRPLWLERISATIYVNDLIKKYNYQKENYVINPVIGEFDVPNMQEQHLLTMPITRGGNALVFGATGSGKENLITTLIYSSMIKYTPEEVNFYIIDFGSEALNCFRNSPIVGDILHIDDVDKINNLFKLLYTVVDERKKMFSDYSGDYITYCSRSGDPVPNIILIINNFDAYHETYSDYDEALTVLTRDGSKYGVNFIFTVSSPNGVRFKLRQNFNQDFVLQQNNESDYSSILGNVRKTYPSKIFGRGIIKKDNIYEFQTAFAFEKEHLQEYIRELANKHSEVMPTRAIPVPVLPSVVTYDDVANDIGTDSNIVIGIAKQDLNVVKFNFRKNLINLVSSTDITLEYSFVTPFINQLLYLNNTSVTLINTEDYQLDKDYNNYIKYIDSNFDSYVEALNDYIVDCHEKYIANNYSRSIFADVRHNTVIILGFEGFYSRLKSENKKKLGSMFEKAKDLEIINFVFVEAITKLKKLELESWYKTCTNSSDGIWIGQGIMDQFTIKVSVRTPEVKEQISDDFCFVVRRGRPILVKYVADFNLELK